MNKPSIPVAVATEVLQERALCMLILDAIEARCSSFALDDETDQRKAAEVIASVLVSQGVRVQP